MCLIFIALHAHPDYPLIVAANRDEFYTRPTQRAHYWDEYPQLLAGRDIQAGGTWLGITRTGRFAAITNYRETDNRTYQKSRGEIVRNFLAGEDTQKTYTGKLINTRSDYAGYNCLYGHLLPEPVLHYYANHTQQSSQLTPGIYGLSNASLDTPWYKVTEGKKSIEPLLKQPFNDEAWFEMLRDKQQAVSELLPDTGIDRKTEKLLSSRFIQSDSYGTRSSTLLTISTDLNIKFIERNYTSDGDTQETRLFQFHQYTEPTLD